ncbi:MAG: hypothetical protein EOP10_29165, partial [Proteobacteria bacterium]
MRRAWIFLLHLPLLLCFGHAESLWAQSAALPKVWSGEIIEADQGLVSLHAVIIDSKMKGRGGDFSFLIRGRKNKVLYSFAAKTQDPKALPTQYWRIREDTYDLLEVSLGDDRGKARKWKGPYSKPFVVSPKNLSSMGVLYLLASKDDPIKVLQKPNHQKFPLDRWKGSVQAVTDAISGEVWQRYQPVAVPAAQNPSIRRVLRGTRSIQMIYKLDLFRFNAFAQDMAKVLQANDPDIRSCYTDLLDKSSEAKGNLIYSFVYSGIDQGIKSLKIKQSTLK